MESIRWSVYVARVGGKDTRSTRKWIVDAGNKAGIYTFPQSTAVVQRHGLRHGLRLVPDAPGNPLNPRNQRITRPVYTSLYQSSPIRYTICMRCSPP